MISLDPLEMLRTLEKGGNVVGMFNPQITEAQIHKLQMVDLDRTRVVLRLRSINDVNAFTLAALAQISSVSIKYIS